MHEYNESICLQAFENVTIIFCGVQLAQADTRADVMQTVAYMNDVYSRIDRLLDTHRVYKVTSRNVVFLLTSSKQLKFFSKKLIYFHLLFFCIYEQTANILNRNLKYINVT